VGRLHWPFPSRPSVSPAATPTHRHAVSRHWIHTEGRLHWPFPSRPSVSPAATPTHHAFHSMCTDKTVLAKDETRRPL